jgi:hypothetical protein
MIKQIKNVLTNEQATKIKENFVNHNFPWYLTQGIVYKKDKNYQFTHNFYDKHLLKSNCIDLINPIIEILKPSAIIRIKANLIVKNNKIIEHGLHKDIPYAKNYKTAIYYVNTNNGYTKFKNEKKIYSEENKLIIFDGNNEHTGTTCTDQDYRIVINFNYFESIA